MNARARLRRASLAGIGLLVACSGSDGTSTGLNGITVAGMVRDLYGDPIGGAVVLVPGTGADTTAANGRFSISGVEPPYDITVFWPSQNTVGSYRGLTRSDPTLLGWTRDAGPAQTATISGTVPPAAGPVSTVFFVGPRAVGLGNADRTTGQYNITVSWTGSATSQSGVLYLLRWQPQRVGDVGVVPAGYDGYASKPLTVSAGGTFSGNDFTASEVTDPPEQTISGSVSIGGYTLKSRALDLEFGGDHFRWLQVNDPHNIPSGILSASFTYTVPAIAGVVFSVYADAYEKDLSRCSTVTFTCEAVWSHFFKRDIPGNSTNVVVPLEAAPHLLSPADSATGIGPAASFGWSQGGATGVYVVSVTPDDPADPLFFVFTTATDAALPDLGGTGLRWPAGAGYRWFVEKDFPVPSIDAAAGQWYWDLVSRDFGWTASELYSFTTSGAVAAAVRGATAPAAPAVRGLVWPQTVIGTRGTFMVPTWLPNASVRR